MSTTNPNCLRLEGGIVTKSSILGVPAELLIDQNLHDAEDLLDVLGWQRQSKEDWYDVQSGNGFVYFRRQKEAVPAV